MLLEHTEPARGFRDGYKMEYDSHFPKTNTSIRLIANNLSRPEGLRNLEPPAILVSTGPSLGSNNGHVGAKRGPV